MRILLVEDDPVTGDVIQRFLKEENLFCDCITTGEEAFQIGKIYDYDVIVLDIGLPDINGHDLLQKLRQSAINAPILVLSGYQSVQDKVKALGIGADDYMTKPFSLEELIARLKAILRRTGSTPNTLDDEKILFADLELNEATHEVHRAGVQLELSPTEFTLLRYLLINADRVVSKSQILDHVWQYDFRGDAGIVETYISYLRKKIDIFDPPLIHTIRGVGYRLRMPPK